MSIDTFGLLPPDIRANVERDEMVDRQMGKAQALADALIAHDPQLRLVFFGDRSEPIYGIKPGRWHVQRLNQGTADTYMPITTPDGGYREPDFGVLEEIRQRDLWRPGALNDRLSNKETVSTTDAEARAEETAHTIRAAKRVAGDGGIHKRKWGRGKIKGVVG